MFAVTFQLIFLQHEIFVWHRNLSEIIPNSDIIATQRSPDTKNSERLIYIVDNIQYTVLPQNFEHLNLSEDNVRWELPS